MFIVNFLDNKSCLPELLISGSEDHNIRVWDVRTGLCRTVLRGHNHIVSCVAIFKNLIVSGSFDETIKVWDLNEVGTGLLIKYTTMETSNTEIILTWFKSSSGLRYLNHLRYLKDNLKLFIANHRFLKYTYACLFFFLHIFHRLLGQHA